MLDDDEEAKNENTLQEDLRQRRNQAQTSFQGTDSRSTPLDKTLKQIQGSSTPPPAAKTIGR